MTDGITKRCYHGLQIASVKGEGEAICYILLPEGLSDDGERFLSESMEKYGCSIAVISGMDWNRDMTPWPAQPVFRKEKSFGGRAKDFLNTLENDYFVNIEQMLGLKKPERYLVGVSLSGLFSLWAATQSDRISGIASISGSFWYDMFTLWMDAHPVRSNVGKIYISLGDHEKKSREARLAAVEDYTIAIVGSIRRQGIDVDWQLQPGITHFSPIIPRLTASLESLFGTADDATLQAL